MKQPYTSHSEKNSDSRIFFRNLFPFGSLLQLIGWINLEILNCLPKFTWFMTNSNISHFNQNNNYTFEKVINEKGTRKFPPHEENSTSTCPLSRCCQRQCLGCPYLIIGIYIKLNSKHLFRPLKHVTIIKFYCHACHKFFRGCPSL